MNLWRNLSIMGKLIALMVGSVVVLCVTNLVTSYLITSGTEEQLAVKESRW